MQGAGLSQHRGKEGADVGFCGHRNATLTFPICPSPEKDSWLIAFASLTYLFKRLQLPAKFKCCPKIRTYKVSQHGSEGFQNG